MGDSSLKRKVYLSEFNVRMGNTVYIPFVSGLLQAYAETQDTIVQKYEFQPYIFVRDEINAILSQFDMPAVAGFSLSMWNEQYTLLVAEGLKKLYPDCLIVFGGPQVPHQPDRYFERYPFIDVAVRGEGETSFSNILTRYLTSRDFSGIPAISWRDPVSGRCVYNEEDNTLRRDIDEYPSPYLTGLYDDLFETYPDLQFQAIIETNRGCPFPCTFCFWGQNGLNTRLRYHSVERLSSEFEWCATHKIRYVFNADANFGMYKQDIEIARVLVDTKKKYGYPEKFRTCFGKNADDQIYDIAKLMHEEDLEKGITLARQSNTMEVLENIRRKNIKMSTYMHLQDRFDAINVPVYTEMILGLPGETYTSWIDGIESLLGTATRNQLFIYLCQVYPNTELADPSYMERFGIHTHRIPLNETHGSVRSANEVTEYEDIVISTKSLPIEDWRRAVVFSWTCMSLHSMKLGYFVIAYLAHRFNIHYTDLVRYISELKIPEGTGGILRNEIRIYRSEIERMLDGHGRGQILHDYGDIYWDQEEATFLRVAENLDVFYNELFQVVCTFLDDAGLTYDADEVKEVVQYQRARIPSADADPMTEYKFAYNIPEYFDKRFTADPILIARQQNNLTVSQKDYQRNKPDFAREAVIWGRKSSAMLTRIKWTTSLPESASA